MKVEIGKTYRTQCGHDVVIYAIYPEQEYPVHGAYLHQGRWFPEVWKLNGTFDLDPHDHDLDLIEVSPERVVWINEYENGVGAAYLTKEEADKFCSPYRIALHRVVLNDDTEWKGEGDE